MAAHAEQPIGVLAASQRAIVNVYTVIALVYCALSAWLFFGPVPVPVVAWVHLVAFAVIAVNWGVLQRTHDFALATHVILCVGTAVVSSLYATGGWGGTGFLWTFAYLPYAFFLASGPIARLWVSILVGVDLAILLADTQGWLAVPYGTVEHAMFYASLGIFLLCMFLFKAAVLRSETRSEQRARELAKANEELQQVDVLKEVSRLKTQFLNTAAHELATPLTPIRLQLHNLRNPAATPERRQHALELVERNVARLGALVQDLLEGARLQSNKLAIERKDVDIGAVVAEAVRNQALVATENGVHLETDRLDPGLWTVGDARRLAQVVDNLLANAVKFTPRGKSVRVRAVREERGLAVYVQDEGIGITPAGQARLFQPFSQVHDTSQQTRAGTGLGLYICKGIVEAHGGRIGVESAGLGQGATFWFVLAGRDGAPAADAPATVA